MPPPPHTARRGGVRGAHSGSRSRACSAAVRAARTGSASTAHDSGRSRNVRRGGRSCVRGGGEDPLDQRHDFQLVPGRETAEQPLCGLLAHLVEDVHHLTQRGGAKGVDDVADSRLRARSGCPRRRPPPPRTGSERRSARPSSTPGRGG